MTHPAVDELWLDLAEGAVPEAEARRIHEHMEGCAECAARYRRLVRAHQLSVRSGAMLREREPSPVPEEVERRVLDAARMAAGSAPRRRTWILPALTAVAAAAAVLLVVRVGGQREDERLLRGTLALLESPAGMRGPDDPLGAAGKEVAERWRGGELRPRAVRTACPGGEVRVLALLDPRGEPAFVAIRQGEGTDVHLYRSGGAEIGSARFDGASRLEFALPPLPAASARSLLAAPGCAAVGR